VSQSFSQPSHEPLPVPHELLDERWPLMPARIGNGLIAE
jgi:hypothetical protein